MNQPEATNKTKFSLLTAFLCLSFALAFTSAGVTRWSILLFAAAPCYFLALVILVAGRLQVPERKTVENQVDPGGWF